MEMQREQLEEITGVIEDTIAYASEQWTIPGQTLWSVVDALAEAKLREFATKEILL